MSATARERELAVDVELHELAWSASEQELVQRGIDLAVELSDSQIGYLHFVNDDQRTIELVTWSRSTLAHCTAVFDRHYPITSAGVWADTARLGRPVIHNDYQALADRRGYPEGHAHLVRHLGVPVVEDGKSRLLLGVGNKVEPYDDGDAACMERLAALVWRLVVRRRRIEALALAEARGVELQRIASVAGWSWDPGAARLRFDDNARQLFGLAEHDPLPSTLEGLLARVDRGHHRIVRGVLTMVPPRGDFSVEIRVRRTDGSTFVAAFKGTAVPRARGQDTILDGILQDLTEQHEFRKLRHLAFHDALTGLSNRQHLVERLERLRHDARRRSDELVAVHFVDLDLFKEVNDRFGHQAGDEVLKLVADRLVHATRREDLTVRMGGDEFVVIQFGVRGAEEAVALGRKLIDAITRPMPVESEIIQVGASVGIALGRTPLADVAGLLAAADTALYRSKAAGGNRATLEEAEVGSTSAPSVG